MSDGAISSEMEPEPIRDSGITSGITELRRAQKTGKQQLEKEVNRRGAALQTAGSVKQEGQELPQLAGPRFPCSPWRSMKEQTAFHL